MLTRTQLEKKNKHKRKNQSWFFIKNFIKALQKLYKNSKLKQRFTGKKHNIFTEKVNKIVLSTNNDKRIQTVNSVGTYAYGTSKDLVKKKRLKWIQ